MVVKKKITKKEKKNFTTKKKKNKFGRITEIKQEKKEKIIQRLPVIKLPKQQKLEDFSMEDFKFPPLEMDPAEIKSKKIGFWEKILGKKKTKAKS